MKCMHRPAQIVEGEAELIREMRAARYTYHRLLDFEDEHQSVLDKAIEKYWPRLYRAERLLAWLDRQETRARGTPKGQWAPKSRPLLQAKLKTLLGELRKVRNADPRWKAALQWADTPPEGAPSRAAARRKAGESDEAFAERCSKRRDLQSRREIYRAKLYAEREIFYDTWNALLASIDQAKKAVIKARAQGLPAKWKRPRWDDSVTLTASAKSFKIVNRGKLWWVVKQRTHMGSVRFKAKFGNWHPLNGSEKLKVCKLTRRKNGAGWSYSVSVAVDGQVSSNESFATTRTVALDWGHREHGHLSEHLGIRVFTWIGDDGERGEVLLPISCRKAFDRKTEIESRIDTTWNARKETLRLSHKNRHSYRSYLMRLGVRTEEEMAWLRWEMRQIRRMAKCEKQIQNVRMETYLKTAKALRQRYATFVFEDEKAWSHKKMDKVEETRHRKRQNRDMSARYEFLSICERFGAAISLVPSRNSTKECPNCGNLDKNTAELEIVCSSCGLARDKDYGACLVLLKRQEALENQTAAE